MLLVLFDIDGTILTDHGASREAFHDALSAVFDYRGDLSRYDFSGRTDPQIARMVLADAGFDASSIDDGLLDLWDRYVARLEHSVVASRVEVMPGVRALIGALASRDDIALALLTGNIEPGARLKLAAPELNDYFPFGAFGSDSADRNELPPVAMQRARERYRTAFEGRDLVIIGDSVHDVRCGVPWEATTIAVATGKTPADLLRNENPHHFFESLEDLDAVMRAIVG